IPPCTSFVDLLLVPLAKSIFSTSATLYPRATASRATPAPVTPPPMTSTSKRLLRNSARLCVRTVGDSGCIVPTPTNRRAGKRLEIEQFLDCQGDRKGRPYHTCNSHRIW